MKVILTEEVIGLGEPGKLVDVAPGYARNFLVPRKLAVYANSASVRELEHHTQRLERKRLRMVEAARSLVDRINGQSVSINARAGQGGKLYGSITTTDIADAIQAAFDITIDRRKISLSEPIRLVGSHEVSVNFLGDARAKLTVIVSDPAQVAAPQKEAAAPAPAPTPEPVVIEEETVSESAE